MSTKGLLATLRDRKVSPHLRLGTFYQLDMLTDTADPLPYYGTNPSRSKKHRHYPRHATLTNHSTYTRAFSSSSLPTRHSTNPL